MLGGGVAWLVNGLVERPTEDVDLFTDTDGAVAAAADKVSAALRDAGYRVRHETADELFAGMDADIREFTVARPRRQPVRPLRRRPRTGPPAAGGLAALATDPHRSAH